MKKYLIYLLLMVAAIGCKKESQKTPVIPPSNTTLRFFLESQYNGGNFIQSEAELTIAGDSAVGSAPVISNQKLFKLTFTPANADIKVGNVVQKSGETVNDFSKPVNYTYTDPKGQVKNIRVSITNFTGIPIFYLTTAAPVVSKDTYVTGSLSINANNRFDQDTASIDLQIKGRGNSTWGMPKKPYRLKFNKKAAMLGLPAAKNWVLLANYSDKTLLRNSTAFAMGHQFSSDFAPHYRFVEVVMNGAYLGSYTLTEQVEVNPARVNIADLGPGNTADDEITGGYLLELDQRLDADKYFKTAKDLPFTINTPGSITDKQFAYIQNYIQQTEDALFADNFADPVNGYAKYINTDSFIDWYLVKELMKDNDGLDFSSIYYYKDKGGKLGMGPIWDFDLAAGNTDYSDCKNPTGWWIKNSVWFGRLFQDPAFAAKVKQRWADLKVTAIPSIFTNIDQTTAYLNLSQQQNFRTWDILNTYVWPNAVVLGSYTAEVTYLKTWLQTRVSWMDANL